MEPALEEITPAYVDKLTREEAQVIYQEYDALQSRIRTAMALLREKIWPGQGKVIDADEAQRVKVPNPFMPRCPQCGGGNIMRQKGNRIFCRDCNISSEGSPNVH